MLTYIGTKTVKATPLTRGEYIAYRGWASPQGEDQTVAGYLVEYEPDGNPNHEDHEGYITWSPARAFDAAYRPANTWQQRLLIERYDLGDRCDKLGDFLDGERTVPVVEWDALQRQLSKMKAYRDILDERINRAVMDVADVMDAFHEPDLTGDHEPDHTDALSDPRAGGEDTLAGSDTEAGADTLAGSDTQAGTDTLTGSDTGVTETPPDATAAPLV